MKVDVKLEGIEKLNKVFTSADDIMKEAVKAGLFKVSQEVAQYAKSNHPYQNQTGNLEASTIAKPVEVEDGKLVGVVQAGMEYAPYVEYGTSRSAPYPFLTPAVQANQTNLTNTVKAVAEAAVKKIVKVK